MQTKSLKELIFYKNTPKPGSNVEYSYYKIGPKEGFRWLRTDLSGIEAVVFGEILGTPNSKNYMVIGERLRCHEQTYP